MSQIDELKGWYNGLTEEEKNKLKMMVVGAIVLLIVAYVFSRSVSNLLSIFGSRTSSLNMT